MKPFFKKNLVQSCVGRLHGVSVLLKVTSKVVTIPV